MQAGGTGNYDPPGSRPEYDIILRDEGTLVVFFPNTVAGADWLDENLPEECPRVGKGYAVESRYARPIVDGIIEDGLSLKMGAIQ